MTLGQNNNNMSKVVENRIDLFSHLPVLYNVTKRDIITLSPVSQNEHHIVFEVPQSERSFISSRWALKF